MQKILINILKAPVYAYRYGISPLLGPRCRFVPSCSEYALEALERHGAGKGLYLSARRLLKCHPFSKACRHDPVPETFQWFVDRKASISYKRPDNQ